MTPIRKKLYWYHEPDEAIPVMEKLKQGVMPYIEFIQYKDKKYKFPSSLKDTLI